ncbi:pilus assembly protein TadG-related protein [Streptomyces flaveolus]
MAGLLFLAFAYLAVGQAAVNRGGAQTAADAAALAAAQDVRDQLTDQWVEVLLDPTKWQQIFAGKTRVGDPCWRAEQLAEQNDAELNSCASPELLKYRVDVKTNKSVGRSVVPGTEDVKSTASATAVIEPLCTFEPAGEDGQGDALPQLTCKDKDWELNPDQPAQLPKPEDLFDVHLG